MDCIPGFAPRRWISSPFSHSATWVSSKTNKDGIFRARLKDEDDPLLRAAINAASIRFQETLKPEPLFVDPYASCFISSNNVMMGGGEHQSHAYCLATRFIDGKLLGTMNQNDELKQVVLFTDGMDTRPYRLRWPTSTLLFDISPGSVFRKAAEKLIGAKLPRNCLLRHVPLESSNLQQVLRLKGFNGNRPSIWAIQGLPMVTLTSLEEILFIVSSLAMKGSLLLGELPSWSTGTPFLDEPTRKRWVDKIFMSNGFQVDVNCCSDAVVNLQPQLESEDYTSVLFVAKHLRLSDDQVETWREEFQRLEDEGDEEGFEEL